MKVNSDVHFYTKTRNHRKTLKCFRKTQNATNYWKSKEYLIPKYKPSWGRVYTFIARQGERFAHLSPVSYATGCSIFVRYLH